MFTRLAALARNAWAVVVVLQAVTIIGLILQTVHLTEAIADAAPAEPAYPSPAGFETQELADAIEAARSEASRARAAAEDAALSSEMASGGVNDILRLGVTCD